MVLIRTRVVLLTAAGALACAPGAAAAPPWSAAQTLSSPHTFVDRVGVIFSREGGALATWLTQDGVGESATGGTDGASRPAGAAAFGAERRIAPQRDLVVGPVGYGRGRAVLATVRGGGTQQGFRIAARFGTTAGRFGAPRAIGRRRPFGGIPVLAANARGLVALAWLADRGVAKDGIYVSLRPPGGRFGRPERLATGALRGVAVAVGASGHVLVAWGDKRGRVHASLKPAGRSGFRRADRITAKRVFNPELSAAVAPGGRAVLGIGSQRRSTGEATGPTRVQAAVKPAGARSFGAARLLESSDREFAESAATEIVAAGGRFIMAWTGHDGVNHRVRVSITGAGGSFGPAQYLSPAGVEVSTDALAAGPDGQALVTWSVPRGDLGGQIQAAFAPPGAAFGPPEAVSPAEEAAGSAGAFDPVSGRPTVVWSNRPAGSNRPLAQTETVAQAATRAL